MVCLLPPPATSGTCRRLSLPCTLTRPPRPRPHRMHWGRSTSCFLPTKPSLKWKAHEAWQNTRPMPSFVWRLAALAEGGQFSVDPTMLLLATRLLNNAAASVMRAGASSCAELSELCDSADGRLVRWVCGETCGCLNPFSSPWYKVAAQGCSPSCMAIGAQQLQNRSCEDVPPSDESWRAFWTSYPAALSNYIGQNLEGFQAFQVANRTIQAMLSGGCPALLRFPTDIFIDATYCDGFPELFGSLASLCPQSCGCATSLQSPGACPASCRANASA